MFYEKKVAVAYLTPEAGDSDKERYKTDAGLTHIPMNIQPASAELTAVADGVYGLTYQAFTPVSGILIGARITVSGSNETFIVKGRQDWFYGPIPHLELILFKGDN